MYYPVNPHNSEIIHPFGTSFPRPSEGQPWGQRCSECRHRTSRARERQEQTVRAALLEVRRAGESRAQPSLATGVK